MNFANEVRRDPSGAEHKTVNTTVHPFEMTLTNPPQEDEVATAILKKKKKPNSLM
jgi:transitional endoplasmic reticulum ATPase